MSARRLTWTLPAAMIVVAALSGCGDDDDGAVAGTLPLFGGTVPPGGPAIDLTPSEEGSAGREVVVVGDSITVASAPLIVAATSGSDLDLTVLAEVGRRITVGDQPPSGTEVVADALADENPDLVVVALGTNDVGKYSTVEEYAAEIEELLALVPDDTPVAWINTYLSRTPDDSAEFNAALLETLGERGNATIGRWSSIAQRDGMLRDGVHPSEEGNQEFADLVVDEIENWLG